ncbi:antitoxin [Streptomyces glomeratus]|uniref:Antitoxin n=1 Tax=Streptomyces glomeratus TaxID=284452 RepID=A0ABP6LWK3_9ACTN|nr:antitoxin [Streptomyces glomeratus]MCF1507519.1 antitoxin [Streptomyces glomeratus]
MGLVDNLMAKVSNFAQQHEGKVDRGLDKAAKMIDERTKGKYSGKIDTGTGKAKHAMERLAHRGTGPATGDRTPPGAPPPAS